MPSARPECRFPTDVLGDWAYFERERKEKITITSGHIKFSQLGEFVCKSKHWSINYFKVLSYYSNGWYVSLCHLAYVNLFMSSSLCYLTYVISLTSSYLCLLADVI